MIKRISPDSIRFCGFHMVPGGVVDFMGFHMILVVSLDSM